MPDAADMAQAEQESVAAGDSVKIMGFGEWSVKDTAARTGRNPKTNEPIEIAAGRKVVFKVWSQLKNSV